MSNAKGILGKLSTIFNKPSVDYKQEFTSFLNQENMAQQEQWNKLAQNVGTVDKEELQQAATITQKLEKEKTPELDALLQDKQFKNVLDGIRNTCQAVFAQAQKQGMGEAPTYKPAHLQQGSEKDSKGR